MTAAFTPSPPNPSTAERSRLSTDWLWGGVGISIASVSASFAAYMIATAPAEVIGTGSKDFNIFVQWDRRTRVAESGPPPVMVNASTDPAKPHELLSLGAQEVDLTPTGSIRTDDATGGAPVRGGAPQTPLRGYVVRNVVGNKALVEHNDKLSLVTTGSILDDAGRVLSIERRGDLWIVQTVNGIIRRPLTVLGRNGGGHTGSGCRGSRGVAPTSRSRCHWMESIQ